MPKQPSRKKGMLTFFNDGREQDLHKYIFSHPDLETRLRNNPAAIVHAIEEFTHRQKMIIFSETKLEKSRSILSEMNPPPKILLEAGTYVGTSAVAWGDMLKTLNGGDATGVKVITFELDADFVKIARDLIELAGLEDVVTVMQGKSTDLIRRLKEEEDGLDRIDVLFLDHWEDAYLPDLHLCEELGLLRKGSVVLADNTDVPGAPEYLEYVKAGGRGGDGDVKYESVSHATTARKNAPSIVEASLVVDAPLR